MQNNKLFVCVFLAACGGASTEQRAPTPVASAETEGHPIESDVRGVHGAIVAAMPTAVTSFGAATIGNDVYLAGGYFGEPHRYSREGQSPSLSRFTAEHGWVDLAPLDVGLQGLALVALDGAILRCGGSRIDNAAGDATDMHSIATCARYSVSENAWSAAVDLPAPRSSFDAAVLDGHVYAVGGWNLEGDSDHARFVDSMLVLDPGATAWRSMPSPVMRRALAVVATTHAIVAIGGLRDDRSPSRDVDVFDPSSGSWSHGPELPGEGFGAAATAIGDDVYASGADGVVYRWHVGDAAWSTAATLAQPRFFHRLVAQNDSLVAIGGIGSMTTDGRARWVETIPLSGAAPRASWMEISFPGTARNRFGLFAHEDSLYVYGGNDSTEQHDFAPNNFVAEAFRLHLPSLRWFPIDPLPEARQSIETVAIGDHAVGLGGFGHDEDAPRTYADAFVSDGSGHWQLVRDALPSPRTQFGTAVHDGAVWIFAGLSYDDALPEAERFTHLQTVLRCPIAPPGIGPCEEAGSFHGTRRAFAGAAIGDRYYAVGGMRDGFAGIDDCVVFDFTTRQSTTFACPSHVRISGTMLVLDGHLYLVGGSTGTGTGLGPDRSVEVFDPVAGTWSTLIDAVPFETHQGRWTIVHDRIFMIETQHEAHRATLAWLDVRASSSGGAR